MRSRDLPTVAVVVAYMRKQELHVHGSGRSCRPAYNTLRVIPILCHNLLRQLPLKLSPSFMALQYPAGWSNNHLCPIQDSYPLRLLRRLARSHPGHSDCHTSRSICSRLSVSISVAATIIRTTKRKHMFPDSSGDADVLPGGLEEETSYGC
ncbi:hypothetical protein OE88DRAFT_1119547 [Heliocybe sulcata]|uniref:Uncharacterized protein n=1 Tax=Heliocybe sulcata TaxID=5364 RepID=A0A5C3MJX2_9AGAM|nr:hypothetical protein OE88DRAFT_1119547 [Heliocybe sulcata]